MDPDDPDDDGLVPPDGFADCGDPADGEPVEGEPPAPDPAPGAAEGLGA